MSDAVRDRATVRDRVRGPDAAEAVAPGDALREAGQQLLALIVQRAAQAATDRVAGLGDRLAAVSEPRSTAGSEQERGEQETGEQDGGESKGLFGRGLDTLKEKLQQITGGGGKGGRKLKLTNIVESLDVGLPLRTTYNLWTQYADFPGFMKKVETVEQASDEKTNWKAQIFLSHRTWEATTLEQVPDSHIVWRSKGPKGHVDGAVSFTGLGPNLTRILLVMEYYPQGLFERTGNLWRAQGRRTRLEFKHFRRHAMTNVILHQQEVEGWRGEIRDSRVVKTHEQALKEEQEQQEQQGRATEAAPGEEPEDMVAEGEAADDSERSDHEEPDASGVASDEEPAFEDEEEAGFPEDEGEYVDEEGEPEEEADQRQ